VFHVKIHTVIPVPAVDREDAEDEEVEDESQRLRQRHKEMNPSRGTIAHVMVQLGTKSTVVKQLER
jgi:hypothetical protein